MHRHFQQLEGWWGDLNFDPPRENQPVTRCGPKHRDQLRKMCSFKISQRKNVFDKKNKVFFMQTLTCARTSTLGTHASTKNERP